MNDGATPAELGRRLYGEKVHNIPAIVYTLLGAVFFLLGILLCFVPPDPRGPPQGMVVGGLLVADIGGVFFVIGLVRLVPNLGAHWELCEHGIHLVRRGGESVLHYQDVEELTWKVVRVFYNDVCTGEVHESTFSPHLPAGKVFLKQVRRPGTVGGTDLDRPGELAQVCDKVAALIACRFTTRLRRGESIPWVGKIHIHPDGLEIKGGKANQKWISWGQIERVGIDQGVFQLWRRGDAQPTFKVKTELPNFFPGFRIILDHFQVKSDGGETWKRVDLG